MDAKTFRLIRELCVKFELPPDIEFTCYECYMEYFNGYFLHFEERLKQMTINTHNQTNQLIDQALDEVEKSTFLHILSLLSICAKYIDGHRGDKLITRLSKYSLDIGMPLSTQNIRSSEYNVFKLLEFNVSNTLDCAVTANRLQHKIFYLKLQIKTSHLYNTVYKLVTKIISRNRDIIRFERLHNCCLSLLRLIYLYRKKSDEMYVFLTFFQTVSFLYRNKPFIFTVCITSNKTHMATMEMRILNWQRQQCMHRQ